MTIRSSSGAASVSADDRLAAGSYILVVEDEAQVRTFLARSLETAGYKVKQADSAAEALELMMSEPAAAVLCDIRMPDPDGLWLADRIHTHWPQAPIVMVTGLDDVETMRKSRDLGAAAYVAKPVAPDELIEVVRRVTATTTLSQPAAAESLARDEVSADEVEAEYALETPVRCPACGERITTLKAVRLIRGRVNFTSTLPRRGRVTACPHCLAIVPAELTNF